MIGQSLPPSSAPLPPGDLRPPEPAVARQLPPWMAYALALLLTVAALIARLAFGFSGGDSPILIIFVVPIVISAYIGGFGPGLTATVLATVLVNATLLQLPKGVSGSAERNLIQTIGLLIAGILISALSEGLRGARRQAEALRWIHTTTLESIGDGVISTDTQGRITFLNAEAARITGWSHLDALGKPVTDVFHIIDARTRAPIEIPALTVLRSGVAVRLRNHTLVIARDGRETPIDDSAMPIRAANATLQGSVLVFRDVTGREHADTALRESQERLAGIVGAAMDAIISIDAAQQIVVFNSAAAHMFGCSAAQVIGQSIEQFIPLPFRGVHASHIRAFGSTGITSRSMRSLGVLTALRVDGTEFPIEATIAQTMAAGQPLYTVIIRDISARIQAEQALRQSESRFATAFRASPIAMSITRLSDGRFIDINTSHEKLFGYPRSMLIGQSADGVNIYADPAQRAEVVRTMRETGALHETELALRTREGEIREVLCSLETIEVDGEVCILGSVFDITARKRAEAALRASEERFRQVFLANPAPKLITRTDTREIIDVNPAFARMTGYAHDELIGQTTDSLGLFQESDHVQQSRSQLIQAGHLMNHEIPIRTRDGHMRDLLLSIVPVDLNGVACYLTVMLDQTERKQAEQARRRAVERLRVLADAARAFAEVAVDYQALLDQVARTTTTALGQGCIIGLISSEQDWVQPVLLYDVDPERNDLLQTMLGNKPLRMDEPAAITRIIQTNQPLLLPLVSREQLRAVTQPAYYDLIERIAMHSLIGVPMRVQGRPIGALMLYRCQTDHPSFDEDDLTLAQDLADRAALAIGNARLLSQVQYELAERTQAEAALRESEERLRAVTDTAQVGLVIVDEEHRYRYANPAYSAIFHLPPGTIVARRVADVLAPVYEAQIRPRLQRAFGGERVSYELVVPPVAVGGEERHYVVTYEPGMYRSETVVVVVVVDITERKRAEVALRRSEERFVRMFRSSPAALSIAHVSNEQIIDVNESYLRLLGYRADEVLGHTVSELGLYALPDQHLELREILHTQGTLDGYELSLRTKSGATREVLASLTTIATHSEETHILGTFVDITERAALAISNARLLSQVQHELAERARAEDTVRMLNAELEQRVADRTIELTAANKELEAFSYSISHDLRAPLRAIDGFSRILLEDYTAQLPDQAQHYFQLVRSNAQQMGRLVDDLLAFSRLSRQPLRKQMVDPAVIVHRCLEDLHTEQEGRQIEIRIDALPSCEADPALLKQVWVNLIANALKYTRRREPAVIAITSQVEEGETIYIIRDNGVGFDMRYRDKLFGVFQRMHRAEDYEGTGVGLAIIQRIIHRHGGRVWADAVVDQGATFFFTLG